MPRHPREGGPIKAVQRNIDHAHPHAAQQRNMGLKQRGIGRQPQVQIIMAGMQHGQKIIAALARKGFPPRQPDLAHAHVVHNAHHPGHFLIAQNIFMRNEIALLHAAAVQAVQIAAIRHRQAQIADIAPVGVVQRGQGDGVAKRREWIYRCRHEVPAYLFSRGRLSGDSRHAVCVGRLRRRHSGSRGSNA